MSRPARERAEGVRSIEGPYETHHVSADGHSALIGFELRGNEMETGMAVSAPRAAVAAAAAAHPALKIAETGDASLYEATQAATDADLQKAELTSLPLTLIILALAFGAMVAAGVPLLLAFTGVIATMGLVGPISHLLPVDHTINSVILLVGLAVGVDYSLFYVRRVREERAAGRDTGAAIEAAAATSGHAVVISGLTVMIAMAGMYLTGSATFTSLATGTVLVVAVSVLGSRVGAARRALEAGRPHRPRPDPAARAPAAQGRRAAASGRPSSTGSCAVRCCRPPRACWCCWRSRSRRSACTPRCPAPRRSRGLRMRSGPTTSSGSRSRRRTAPRPSSSARTT